MNQTKPDQEPGERFAFLAAGGLLQSVEQSVVVVVLRRRRRRLVVVVVVVCLLSVCLVYLRPCQVTERDIGRPVDQ